MKKFTLTFTVVELDDSQRHDIANDAGLDLEDIPGVEEIEAVDFLNLIRDKVSETLPYGFWDGVGCGQIQRIELEPDPNQATLELEPDTSGLAQSLKLVELEGEVQRLHNRTSQQGNFIEALAITLLDEQDHEGAERMLREALGREPEPEEDGE